MTMVRGRGLDGSRAPTRRPLLRLGTHCISGISLQVNLLTLPKMPAYVQLFNGVLIVGFDELSVGFLINTGL
ncbi:hypothetical protein AG1IA_08702 [Rhizoctonia solani AG-1 IA]|uniref:Uncharacterized protein n=1 Tax=Thanatephorus cucumeris (strain AG1-IA) TaxID=983506 RepID=L8WH92_THACA|nr:hypothetical protein AG1IA_08702 [Rhizoctonia solani AG-1 IA]